MGIHVTSSAFSEGANIPTRYACDGEDVSPHLSWSGKPEGTKSIALIADDPNAPGRTFVHWVVYSVPASAAGLPDGVSAEAEGHMEGRNDFGRRGYGGPCPPPGNPHRYFFKVYALGSEPGLEAGARNADLARAMEGRILAEVQLMGTFQRR